MAEDPRLLTISLPAEPVHLSTLRLFVAAAARRFGLPPETVADVRLAASEIASAAIEARSGPRVWASVTVLEGQAVFRFGPAVDRTAPGAELRFDLVETLFSGWQRHPEGLEVRIAVGDDPG